MTATTRTRIGVAVLLVVALLGGLLAILRATGPAARTRFTAYFENSNGIFPGDGIRILGVPVGKIESIEAQPQRAKITFWVDAQFKVPADAKAVILSPTLVTARYIQLTPAYTGGPKLADNAVIPKERTAVPVEFDDLRTQLAKLNQALQPTQPGGMSTSGEFVKTVADNLRGQGASIRDTVISLSQSLSILGDHSGDIFGTVRNLAVLVSALRNSADLSRQLNENLAAVSAVLANDPNEVGQAVSDLNTAVNDARGFIADNREALGITVDKLTEITTALDQSKDDVKQALHVFPTALANYLNIYQPAHLGVAGALSGSNFANPLQFICGAIQAASRLDAEQSAKLCVQYLAPIVKNRQYNFLGPLGLNLPVGATARPNEITFSEDRMRPDFVPPAAPPAADAVTAPLPAEASGPAVVATTDPSAGLTGLMVPPGG
jgi:phospholipid/cholesterol/gamma-HCH transport system substrate-binding protein